MSTELRFAETAHKIFQELPIVRTQIVGKNVKISKKNQKNYKKLKKNIFTTNNVTRLHTIDYLAILVEYLV